MGGRDEGTEEAFVNAHRAVRSAGDHPCRRAWQPPAREAGLSDMDAAEEFRASCEGIELQVTRPGIEGAGDPDEPLPGEASAP